MTTAVLIETLTDAMLEAIRKAGTKKVRGMSTWVVVHFRSIVDQYSETLLLDGLDQRLRALLKKQAGSGNTLFDIAQLCFDLGLPALDLDDEVSVPTDKNDLSFGSCEYVTIDEITAEQVDAHILLMEAQIELESRKLSDWKAVRQAMLRIGKGRADIPMWELRRITPGERQ